MIVKKLSLLSFLMLFLSIGTASAQLGNIYMIDPAANPNNPDMDGKTWANAFPDFETAMDYVSGDVIIMLKNGIYPKPIKVWGEKHITSIKIYGGCMGFEMLPMQRMLNDPACRTYVEGTDNGIDSQPAIWLETNFSGTTLVDGLTVKGGGCTASLALKVIYATNVIISRCRFEGTDHSGSLILTEAMPRPDKHVSFVNCVIANNSVSTLATCRFGFKFINTTIVDNTFSTFMSLLAVSADTYEIKNSIIYNNSNTMVSGQWDVDVYHSIVDDFTYLHDTGVGNHSGINVEFTSDNENDPYAHIPSEYITACGDFGYISPYLLTIGDYFDIIGTMRFSGASDIDLGAYQGAQTYAAPMRAPEDVERNGMELPAAIRIYPTSIHSGESVYIENSIESGVTAHIYSVNGIEVYSAPLYSSVEQVSISVPNGMYIIIVTDDITGKRLYCEKIMVH